ncbi:LOW QUALITY PROTEIN: DNA excision repair protein ERCC-6-like [Haliotis rubra]|uniref:LOW QUALITY PROTEIN: DNA excision repair protein ERCC-6-like n=1 Tax=Haliotis rubra TaxID=36100 RepID=UPI001EE57648|nr:LOW QUALITY PROTEIN: DNA excision repair protein ERCC-6-like [Haliotis rubra]
MASAATGLGGQRASILIEPEPVAGPSSMADDNMDEGEVAEEKMGFHVNTKLIPKALLEEQSELEGLGLGVFNQQEFEDGVMAQVDQAMALEEEERLRRILTKEMTAVEDDFKMANQELTHINKVMASMPQSTEGVSRDVRHTIEAIKKQRDNKMKHLKKLESRKSVLQAKMDNVKFDAGVLVAPLGQQGKDLEAGMKSGKTRESERDRMIRLGHMTPFGTIIKNKKQAKPRPSTSPKDSANKKKHKLSANGKLSLSQGVDGLSPLKKRKGEKTNMFDERDHKLYNRETDYTQAKYQRRGRRANGSGEASFGDEESDMADSGDEWRPSGQSIEDEDDALELLERRKERKSFLPEKHVPPAYDNGVSKQPTLKVKKDTSIHKAKDDGDERYYQRRLKEYQRTELLKKFERESRLDARGEDDNDSEEDEEFDGGLQVPGIIWKNLYQYQRVGVRWLWELHCQEAGGIVGDEMGLGKTIQTIAFLAALRYSKLRNKNFPCAGLGPCVIVCPATVMHQWVKEFHKWWPPFRVAILHSSGSYSGKEQDLVYRVVRNQGVIVTSFSTLVIHQDIILPYNWHYVILDEGHKIRNPNAQITLACKQFRTPHRIILSGSPIQNHLKELWSLFDFIFPGKLGMLPDFLQHFSVPIVQGGYANATQVQVETAYKCATVLRDTINPFLLRRMKADVKVGLDLPQKNEQVLFCRLTDEQREVYQEYLDSRECQAILSGKYKIFAGLITLRKVCNHPDLSTGGPRILVGEDTHGDETLDYGYYKRSGKMIVVEALLKLWQTQGHRVLLFSQSRTMLDIMEFFVQKQMYSYLRMDGTSPIASRQQLIDQFNKDPSIYVFLLTTRVGGLGVNLTGANRVIIFDPDWNPSTDTQARERAWRIGQKKQVTIYRLLTSGTIEEKIYHRQIFKQFLTNRVLKDPKQRRFFKSNDIYELFTLTDLGDGEGTETSAIFAGTGSDVTVPRPVKNKRKKRKVNRFDEMKKESKSSKEDSFENTFDTDEIQRMREMARMLSQRMEKDKNKTRRSESGGDMNGAAHTTSKQDNDHKPPFLKDTLRNKDKKHKKKKKKKSRDAKFEGERIPHLDRRSDYKDKDGDAEEKKNDDYVLQELFKKTGIQGALQHDKIMSSGRPDFALVEAEAEKVAKQAVAALKKSRSQCHSALAGIPTWTGQHGGGAKPKFGKKKNSLLADKIKPMAATSTATGSKMPDKSDEDRLFNGSISGTVALTANAAVMSSDDLLSKMRCRHNLSKQGDEDIGGNPDKVDTKDLDLMTDIRNYIAFQCHVDGQAATRELLDQFGPRLPKGGAARFKAMLNQICDLDKSSGVGIWRLRTEFR